MLAMEEKILVTELSWAEFVDTDFSLTNFPPGTRIIDIGCGAGRHLRELVTRGCIAVGVDPNGELVSELKSEGFSVEQCYGESLPFNAGSFDGIVSSVTMPYTDEQRAINEWARILRSGGEVRVTYHGVGYYLRYLLKGPNWKYRFYAIRTILNTWYYACTGHRLPTWLGDTLYQSEYRLRKYYKRIGLRILEAPAARTYFGFTVFIAHRLTK